MAESETEHFEILSLDLEQFRSFRDHYTIFFDKQRNLVIFGLNGSGKT